MLIGLYFVTDLAPFFTLAAHDVLATTGDAAVAIPSGVEGGSLDFASSPLAWIICHLTYTFKWIGVSILVIYTCVLVFLNRRAIIRYQNGTDNENINE
jgi:PTS system galactitol-specific IIC component